MKLDTKAFRYLAPEDWRVLTGVEQGSKNHEVVPTPLIIQLSGLRAGSSGAQRSISTLAKAGLIAREKNVKYDGYRLTYGGLDYLALHSHTKSSSIIHLGSQMGVGKESDIYLVTSPTPSTLQDQLTNPANPIHPVQAILKIHRLGRTSFRTLRTNRAYHGTRSHCSWQYLSRLSAQKEFAAMRALHAAGFPVPRPIAWNRHTVVMSLIPGIPLRQVPLSAFGAEGKGRDERIARLYGEFMEMALRLAEVGLIHGDYNEFNILIENVPEDTELEDIDDDPADEDGPTDIQTLQPPAKSPQSTTNPKPLIPHLIDFPQITSLSHPQARAYFDRDISCIKRFFRKRYHFSSDDAGPTFEDARARLEAAAAAGVAGAWVGQSGPPSTVVEEAKAWRRRRLDVEIEAAGFSRKLARELEAYYDAGGEQPDEGQEAEDEEEGVEGSGDDEDVSNADDSSCVAEEHMLLGGEDSGALLNRDGDNVADVDEVSRDQSIGANVLLSSQALSNLQLESKLRSLSVASHEKPRTKAAAGWSI